MKSNEIIRRTITLSYDNLEACVLGFLYATKTIPPSWDVLSTEIGVPLNEDGLVEIELELTKPKRKDTSYQPELPLEVFDNVYVKGS